MFYSWFLFLSITSSVFGQVGQSCSTSDGGSGTCIDTNTQSCNDGILEPGFCPGPNNIVCCATDWGGCSVNGEGGTCEVTNACGGQDYAGYCPGPDNVQCCVSGSPPPSCSCGQTAADNAIGYIGCPYVWAGTSCSPGFDCSGMTMVAYSSCLQMDHYSGDQCTDYGWNNGCSINDLSDDCWIPGDLLCFNTDGSLSHVGMYVGEGNVVDCLNPDYGCHEWNSGSSIYSYYQQTFDHGQRVGC